jgi:predicted lipoprotein with Yx(FWY)xxD motif
MRLRTWSLMVAIVLTVVACGGDQGGNATTSPDNSGAPTTSEAAPEVTTTVGASAETSTTAAVEMDDAVHVAETDLGPILVDPEGFTLYVFDADIDGDSTCYDACAGNWPPVPADTAIGSDLDPSVFASTTRTDGSEQLTINGMPLYRFASDSAPGDTNGQGLNGLWWVVDGEGNVVEASAASTIAIDYGY